MKTKEIPIEQRYGYHIISTDEDKKKFAPIKESDEYYRHAIRRWEPSSLSYFSGGNLYRRKIDVGEGFELVGLEEAIKENDEWSEDGIEWWRLSFGVGVTVMEYHQNESRIIHHIRRKKSATKPESKTFFMVQVEGRNQPRKKHESIDEATTEAKRLALQESKSAMVLECKEVIRVNYVPPTTEVTKL